MTIEVNGPHRFLLSPTATEWHDWIEAQGRDFSLFMTGTFDRDVREDFARRAFLRWVRRIGRRLLPAATARSIMLPFVATVELQRSGRPHVHGAVAKAWDMDPLEAAGFWREEFGQEVVVENYDDRLDGLGYLLKHVRTGDEIIFSRELIRRVV
jgi:hypothetical protein